MDWRGEFESPRNATPTETALAVCDTVFSRHTMMKPWMNVCESVTRSFTLPLPFGILLMRFALQVTNNAGGMTPWQYLHPFSSTIKRPSLLIIRLQRRGLAK